MYYFFRRRFSTLVHGKKAPLEKLLYEKRLSVKVLDTLFKKYGDCHQDYVTTVSKTFPQFVNSLIITRKLLEGKKFVNQTEMLKFITENYNDFIENNSFTKIHFDLVYRIANPLFTLEKVDSLPEWDIRSHTEFSQSNKYRNVYTAKYSPSDTPNIDEESVNGNDVVLEEEDDDDVDCHYEEEDEKDNESIDQILTKKGDDTDDQSKLDQLIKNEPLSIVKTSNYSTLHAASQLLLSSQLQTVVTKFGELTDDEIQDVIESKLHKNYPDFGDHNPGIVRQLSIKFDDKASNKVLGIILSGGDIVSVESKRYLERNVYGPVFLKSIQKESFLQDEPIFEGDQIIAINMADVRGVCLPLVKQILKDALNNKSDSLILTLKNDPLEYKLSQLQDKFNAEKFTTFNRALAFDAPAKPRMKRRKYRMPAKVMIPRL